MLVQRVGRTMYASVVLLQGIGERLQRIFDAVNAILGRVEVAALTAWASLGVIFLILLGVFSLYRTVVWVKNKPPFKEILTEMGRLLLAFLVVLVNIGLPLGAIAVIPGAGTLVTDLFNAIFG